MSPVAVHNGVNSPETARPTIPQPVAVTTRMRSTSLRPTSRPLSVADGSDAALADAQRGSAVRVVIAGPAGT